jgi:hypothetical protein
MAASTITRDTWTNDSGTPANPVGDGTLIGNTQLQNHIYARIDELFAGAGAYATLTLGGKLAAEGFGTHTFAAGGSGAHLISVRNTAAGTTNVAGYELGNDASASAGALRVTASSFTASGSSPQDGLALVGGRAGGISIAAEHASGALRFYTGGTTLRTWIDSAGNCYIGTAGSGTPRRLQIVGAGAATISDGSDKGASVLVSDTGGGAGNGGAIEFGAGYGSFAQPYFAAIKGSLTGSGDNTVGDVTIWTRPVSTDSGLTELARLTNLGMLLLGDTANAKMTRGLTVNQGGADDEIITIKSSDVAHAFTNDTEADSYGTIRKAANASGGISMSGYTSDSNAVHITGQYTNGDATKGTTAAAPLVLVGNKLNVNTAGAMGANENILVVRNNTTTRFILDADGDSHQDVGTAWTNFDAFDDLALLNGLSAALAPDGDPLKMQFAGWVKAHRSELERLRLVTFNEDGHHFINWSRLHMVAIGAIRQVSARISTLERTIHALDEGR